MTYLLYIGYQNLTRIHIEKGILSIILLVCGLTDYNKKLLSFHDKYVVVPVDKTSSNIVFICKHYYCGYSIKEYGISKNSSIPTSFDKDDIAA